VSDADAAPSPARPGRSRLLRWGLGFVVFAVVMAGISFLTLSSWSELRRATPAEAAAAFAEARATAGGGPAYIAIDPDGTVHVRRELEREEPAELAALHLEAWDPGSGRLVHTRFPYWFVRLKLSRTLNLGTFTTFLAGDWEHLDLAVTEDDLARRGPGLVLDHETAGGARILLWNE
jgi:hypothetical protein